MLSRYFFQQSTRQSDPLIYSELLEIKGLINSCIALNIPFDATALADREYFDKLPLSHKEPLKCLHLKIFKFVQIRLNQNTTIIFNAPSYHLFQQMTCFIFSNLHYFFYSLPPDIMEILFTNRGQSVVKKLPHVMPQLYTLIQEINPDRHLMVVRSFESFFFRSVDSLKGAIQFLPIPQCVNFLQVIEPILFTKFASKLNSAFNRSHSLSFYKLYEALVLHLDDEKRRCILSMFKSRLNKPSNSEEYAIYLTTLTEKERSVSLQKNSIEWIHTSSDFEEILLRLDDKNRRALFHRLGVQKITSLVFDVTQEEWSKIPSGDAALDFLITYLPGCDEYAEARQACYDLNMKIYNNDMELRNERKRLVIPVVLHVPLKRVYGTNIIASHLGCVLKYIPSDQCHELCTEPDIYDLILEDVMSFWTVMASLSLPQRAVIYDLVKEKLLPLTKPRSQNSTYEISLIRNVLTDAQYLDLQMRKTTIDCIVPDVGGVVGCLALA